MSSNPYGGSQSGSSGRGKNWLSRSEWLAKKIEEERKLEHQKAMRNQNVLTNFIKKGPSEPNNV